MGTLTISRADSLTPETARNQIVRDVQQIQNRGPSISDVLPSIVLNDSEETYYRRHSGVLPMSKTSLSGESPVGQLEDMEKDTMNVDTFKEKVAPEKGVDFEINTQNQLLDVWDDAMEYLRRVLTITREVAGWQGLDGVEGFIGQDGATAHSGLSTSHVIAPGTAFSDTVNSNPQDSFTTAEFLIDDDGTMLDELPRPTAYVSPSVMRDLKQNEDLQARFSGVGIQGLTEQQVANVLPFENIQTVYTKTVRTNANGQPVDDAGNVVEDRKDAAKDNILEPHDGVANQRNVVIGTGGDVRAGGMPVLTGRLAEMIGSSAADPTGDFSVDRTLGFVTQMWTTPDPAVSWFKIAQEFGVEVVRPDNWAILQGV